MEKFLELVKSPRILHKWTIPVWLAMNFMAVVCAPENDQSFSVMMVVCAGVWLVTANGFIEAAVQENEDAFRALFGINCLFTILLAGSFAFQGLAWDAAATVGMFFGFVVIPVLFVFADIWLTGANLFLRTIINILYTAVWVGIVWVVASNRDLIIFKLRAFGVAI